MLTDYEIKNVSKLNEVSDVITKKAKELGLDFYTTVFEVVPARTLYSIGAYGMPTRYNHWSFGKAYYKIKTLYEHGFGKLYEMVINTDPCYAFLVEDNTLSQNMMIMAHVLAHCDFFKNNRLFKMSRRDMIESMGNAGAKIREYERKHGKDEVELLLDAAHSISRNIDFYDVTKTEYEEPIEKTHRSKYDDLWEINAAEIKPKDERKKIPPSSEFDILRFIINNNHKMEDWEKDILTIVRDESYYFYPQLETGAMNEGWATFWHKKIMRNLDLTFDQTLDFAKLHAGVVAPNPYQINPYHVCSAIFEDIEKRWDETFKAGEQPLSGLEKIFEIRANETDESFLRNYLTKELVEQLDLYLYVPTDKDPDALKHRWWDPVSSDTEYYWVISEKEEWEKVRDGIVNIYANRGTPVVSVEDSDYQGALLLKHHFDGLPLDRNYTANTLAYISMLWDKKPVCLSSVFNGVNGMMTYYPNKHSVSIDPIKEL